MISMPPRTEEYTLGIEEEYQVIDPETRELRARAGQVFRRAQQTLGEEGKATPELFAAQIETNSSVCRTLAEVRAQILRLRRGIIEEAAKEGARIAAASTHPFSRWQEQPVARKKRYKGLIESYQRVFRQQLVFGLHVHVGLSDREAAVQVMNRARVWLGPMLAVSANSPFWLGADTGYASYRTQTWSMLPMSGPPGYFGSLAEHDDLVKTLVSTGIAAAPHKIYWDMRLSEHFGTVELRVMDMCTRVDEAVMVAGLARALVRTCHEQVAREEPYPKVRTELLRGAHWLAARYGLEAELMDVEEERTVPALRMIEKMMIFLRPALEESGDWQEVSALVGSTLKHGNGAMRQRQMYERAGRLQDVVDLLIEETAEGAEPA
jgi:glutamate---cysteine ligase / carboxylate-amine ligase